MLTSQEFKSRDEVFDFLDAYAYQRKEEIDRRHLDKGSGFLKSYVIETSAADQTPSIPDLFSNTGWQLNPINRGDIYDIHDQDGRLGFVEPISSRYAMLHSFRETKKIDATVAKTVQATSRLDSLWLSGEYFLVLWNTIILPQMPERFVTMKFEHLAQFEEGENQIVDDTYDEDFWGVADDYAERRASTSSINERARKVGDFLPALQRSHSAFKAIKMLRLPANERGGYDFWSNGKVTYRAPSFREGREQIMSVTDLYAKVTEAIEERMWMRLERTKVGDVERNALRGTPLVLTFSQPLSAYTIRNLVDITFERTQGPLRLWGNPIKVSETKFHVYGIDMHLWQRIYVEITPNRIVVVLPEGSCGNTVHRLITNIQHYVDPAVKMFIGDVPYSDLVQDILLGREMKQNVV